MSGDTLVTKDAVDPLIHKAYLEELADAYAPPPIDRRDPLISPLFGDLRGFPPMLIQVGSAETLIADATRLAEAAGHCRRRRAPGDLAAHDPRLAAVERRARGRPACACRRRRIRPRMAGLDATLSCLANGRLRGSTMVNSVNSAGLRSRRRSGRHAA